ncbi:uncharacterized protein LOC119221694 isoform X2 [Pungitius pungitius]|uniref:uncharacterized protein LOC119221694 isoform X2 n=1 Tax=Pungitius pungitius TaxID=134920 RepID=UPI002E0D8C7C
MEQSFADLLSDAFAAVPPFPDEDLDFENLNIEEKFEADQREISQDNLLTEEDGAAQQEATGRTADLSNMETNYDNETSEEEDIEGAGFMSRDKTLQEDYTSSDEEIEEVDSEEDEEDNMGLGEKTGDLSKGLRCSNEVCDGDKEDRFLFEGQPLTPGVRIEESDEEVSYLSEVPKRGNEMMIRSDGIKNDAQDREKEEDTCDCEGEGTMIEQQEAPCCELESPRGDGTAGDTLFEFPEISVQNLQDLIAEVDSEKFVEKMNIFSGVEHQEAGESFADYPSDFSSCEYVEDGGQNLDKKHQSEALPCASGSSSTVQQNTFLQGPATGGMRTGRAEDSDRNLHSRYLERGDNEFSSADVANGEKRLVENVSASASVTGLDDGSATGGSESSTSSDDEVQEKRSDEELFGMCLQDLNSIEHLENTRGGRRTSFSDFYDRVDPADFNIHLNPDLWRADLILPEDVLTTGDTDEPETPLSGVTPRPADSGNRYPVVHEGDAKTTKSSHQGSLDDDFFFNTEPDASGITETGQLGDDESEDERNWQQEQQRIRSFYEFYNDSDGEDERGGRLKKVQFCADPLSQVIHYETDSDRASLSSSIDGEEDLSSAETSEGFNMLKPTLKIGLAILTGLLMFWFATDRVGYFDHLLFF